MSLFKLLEDHLPSLKAMEQEALNLAANIGHDISVGSHASIKAAESAWKFVVANVPELEAAATIIATSTGNAEVVPAIDAAGAGLVGINNVINHLATTHTNMSVLADSVSQLSAVVSTNLQANGGDQTTINVANQVSQVAAKVASASNNLAMDAANNAQVLTPVVDTVAVAGS